ncbi:MAG: hypothetical protein BGO55_25545 [Sphingobacteriales bacterium 50-39]|nr:hypothetical protein [Sphingobacteriales bacterium]OJW54561.1 MAG: hypothetical protein BGO55_25545 [Sphingobacteriales bacterium 50-39]
MKILLLFVVITTLSTHSGGISQIAGNTIYLTSIDWQGTKNWKLYNIRSRDAFTFPLDTLTAFKSVPLDQDSMMLFLENVTQIPEGNNPVWMGAYVATCQLTNGCYIKMEFSQYGSFFYVENERRYYQLSDDVRDIWLPFLTSKWLQVQGAK